MNFPHGETVTIVTAGTDADPYSGDARRTASVAMLIRR